MHKPSPALEAFALKTHHYGRISGVSLAMHAIRDGFLLLHGGVGCKYKAAAQISVHDWARQPHRREGWTEVGDAALIKGAAQRIGPYVRSWYDRQRPSLMVVTTASHLEMTGEDIAAEIREAEKSVPCPVRYIPGLGFEGDLHHGYNAVLEVVVDLIPWAEVTPSPEGVAVVGYLFDRYEADHGANLQQLRAMLSQIGLRLEAVLLSGQPLAQLQRAARAKTIVLLPYAHHLADGLRATGRTVVCTDLPVSLRGSSSWLAQVGEAAGLASSQVKQASQKMERYARREVESFRNRMLGLRSAIFADPPLASALVAVAEELAVPPRLVGLRGRSLGGASWLEGGLERLGTPLRQDTEVREDPSYWWVRARLAELQAERAIQVTIGSASEVDGRAMQQFISSPLSTDEVRRAHEQRGSGNKAVEVGFPAAGFHAVHPQPYFGYGGVLALAQRIGDRIFAS